MDFTVISTYRCNSRCSMCHVWQNPTLPDKEITLETMEKIPEGIDNLNITGGEPTLRSDLPEMVDLLYPKAKTLEISSNGLLPERLLPIIKKYPDIKVRFSLEGFEETNNLIRGEKDGFNKKVAGMLKLKEAGGTDLGFATVLQDDNVAEFLDLYRFTQKHDLEFATSALHNAFQFHKIDNNNNDKEKITRQVEGLISEMLMTNSVKNWFRAYLNLGLINKILGQGRLIPCTAGTDFIFLDPWSDVYACNVRPDLYMGNIKENSWSEIWSSEETASVRLKVAACQHNCWMVTTARTAMRYPRIPFLPKLKPAWWVLTNKIKLTLGMEINFHRYIDYKIVTSDHIPSNREYYLEDKKIDRTLQVETNYYAEFRDVINQ